MNISYKLIFFIAAIVLLSNPSYAKVELHEFDNEQQHTLYKKLAEQLRCLVCQNQNLADSNAELAQDMRSITYDLVMKNKTEQDIIDYWVTRYGDFVLYNPPFKRETLILWLGPFVLLLIALFFGKNIVQKNNRKSSPSNAEKITDDAAHASVRKFLDE